MTHLISFYIFMIRYINIEVNKNNLAFEDV